MRFLPQIPALAAVVAVAAIACSSSAVLELDLTVEPSPAVESDEAVLGTLPPNGIGQLSITSGFVLGKQQDAYSHGMELYLPQYVPAGFHVITHEIGAYQFDVGISYAAIPGTGSEVSVSQSADERPLPAIGRAVDIDGVPGRIAGSEEAGAMTVYFNRDGSHFIIDSFRSNRCGEPCSDFSEAITLAVARSLRPVPLDPSAEVPEGVVPLMPANGIAEAFPENHDQHLVYLDGLAKEAKRRLHLPTYVPDGYAHNPQVSFGRSDKAIVFIDQRTSNWVRVAQSPWVDPGPPPGGPIAIGDAEGAIVGSARSGHVEIRFTRDGTKFEIIGPRSSSCQGRCRLEFNNDVFLRIAKSMRPAEMDGEGIPRPVGYERAES